MFLLHFFSRILTHHQACLCFVCFLPRALLHPSFDLPFPCADRKHVLPVTVTESRLRPVALHDSQIETDVQNKNVSLFCVQPATTNLPYCMMELSVTMVTVVTSGNSTVQIVLLIALGMLLEPRRSE